VCVDVLHMLDLVEALVHLQQINTKHTHQEPVLCDKKLSSSVGISEEKNVCVCVCVCVRERQI